MKVLLVILVGCVVSLTARSASAQPFFGGGVVAFNPEISVVYTGVVTDVQSTVSYDRKYVTINMQAQDSRLLSLRSFAISTAAAAGPAQGFVGNVSTTSFAPANESSSPDEIDRRAVAARSILSRRGMFLLRVN